MSSLLWGLLETFLQIGVCIRENPLFQKSYIECEKWYTWSRRCIHGCRMEPQGDWIYYGYWNYSADSLLEMYDTWWDACEKEEEIGEFPLVKHSGANLVMIRLYEPVIHRDDKKLLRTACYITPRMVRLRGLYFQKRIKNPVLSLQYRHPDLEKPLMWELSEDLCLEDNELLSAAFVKRWLDYEVGKHIPFDERYELAMVYTNDTEDIETVVLKQGDYVRLTDNSLKKMVEGKTE